jgi:5S rRNA maturation endonuclease (ribonuclease M5)
MIKSCYLNIISTMGYRSIDNDTINQLREYIDMLNEESQNGSVIVVEGKRDVAALSRVGFNGNVTVYHHFRGITDFVDNYHLNRKKIILLLDMDRTGKQLTSKLVTRLQYKGNNVTLFYKRALAKITNGKVRHVEDLVTYAPHLSGVTGSRKDLYFYI